MWWLWYVFFFFDGGDNDDDDYDLAIHFIQHNRQTCFVI